MDSVKEAFYRVRQDMDSLRQELDSLKEELREINEKISLFLDNFEDKKQDINPTNPTHNPTNPTHNPTHNMSFKPLKPQNIDISIGNDGVPTDKQTNQQTNQHIQNESKFNKNTLENASEILNSLDSIKKEIRLQFKGITEQEMLVFSSIYQLEEEGEVNYRLIAKRLNLTESSIRDYVGKLIKKGIPVDKKKINNKNITLSISENLKKIASLSTILKLREL
ncbi:MAG TPA: winged helix-turn-helix domain-containing protein [Patescibacteria group bacterium]|nr:winged helix-turn-helix domain-containing protein [Patescibacteria group bacterium]